MSWNECWRRMLLVRQYDHDFAPLLKSCVVTLEWRSGKRVVLAQNSHWSCPYFDCPAQTFVMPVPIRCVVGRATHPQPREEHSSALRYK